MPLPPTIQLILTRAGRVAYMTSFSTVPTVVCGPVSSTTMEMRGATTIDSKDGKFRFFCGPLCLDCVFAMLTVVAFLCVDSLTHHCVRPRFVFFSLIRWISCAARRILLAQCSNGGGKKR